MCFCMGIPGSTVCQTEIALCLKERDLSVSPAIFLCSASLSSRTCMHQLYRGSSSANSKAATPFFEGSLWFDVVLFIDTFDSLHLLWVDFLERLVLCTLPYTSNTPDGPQANKLSVECPEYSSVTTTSFSANIIGLYEMWIRGGYKGTYFKLKTAVKATVALLFFCLSCLLLKSLTSLKNHSVGLHVHQNLLFI